MRSQFQIPLGRWRNDVMMKLSKFAEVTLLVLGELRFKYSSLALEFAFLMNTHKCLSVNKLSDCLQYEWMAGW
jgi:hypothetical protein